MLNIHNAHNFERVLPEHMELLLCERDQTLNRLAPKQLMETLKAPESIIVVYQVNSINSAHSGASVSPLAAIFLFINLIFM
jgi:hypothetical protein